MKNLMSDMSQQRSNIKFHSSVLYDSEYYTTHQCHRQDADYTVLHINRMIVHLGHVH